MEYPGTDCADCVFSYGVGEFDVSGFIVECSENMMTFTRANNIEVITSKYVIKDRQPVLYVRHSMGGEWQFHCGNEDYSAKNIMLVSLSNLLECDKTLDDISDLPLNCSATRDFVGDEWTYDIEPPDAWHPYLS